MKEAPIPDLKSMVMTFWVRLKPDFSAGGAPIESKFDETWMTGHIEYEMVGEEVGFPTCSYHSVYPQLVQSHVWTYPFPGAEGSSR